MRSDSIQPEGTLPAEAEEPSDAARVAAEPTVSSTPQQPPAQEGVVQTPQRMNSASAFSVFMSPLVRGSGQLQ